MERTRMERRCAGFLSASTPFGFSVPGLVCAVRKHLETYSIFHFQQEGLFYPLPSFINLLQIMKALLLDFASRWLSGFILCQALCSRHFTVLDTRGKPRSLKRAHTWEAHCQGPQTQQTGVDSVLSATLGSSPGLPHLLTLVPYSPPAGVEDYYNFDQNEACFCLFSYCLQLILERSWVETSFLCHLQKFTTLLFFQWVWSAGVVPTSCGLWRVLWEIESGSSSGLTRQPVQILGEPLRTV